MNAVSSRRDFFRLSAGALVATAALPGCRPPECETTAPSGDVFPQRGNFERLMLACSCVNAGATAPFSVLHVSDTHLTAAYPDEDPKKQQLKEIRTKTFGGRQEEALRDSLAWAKTNADYVLHTGDLIDWQSRANFDLVKKYFGTGMFGCLGNHEYSRNMWLEPSEPTEAYKAGTRAAVSAAFPFDVSVSSKLVNGVNFVTLDDVYGTVTEDQVARFAEEAKKGLPIVLCMHVPFYTENIWRVDRKFWTAAAQKGEPNFYRDAAVPEIAGEWKKQREDPVTRDFIAYLKKEPLLKAILAGHLHLCVEDRFSPTAMEYVVGGNFLFHGREILFS